MLDGEPVYLSLRPGTIAQGDEIAFTNQRTGLTVSAALVAGGLDPVGIEAVAGDTIHIAIGGGGLLADLRDASGDAFGQATVIDFRTNPATGSGQQPPVGTPIVGIYDRTTPSSDPTQTSRVVFHENGRFEFQYSVNGTPEFSFHGSYTHIANVVSFTFDAWNLGGPWLAKGVLADGTLQITFNVVAGLVGFDDGSYTLSDPGIPPSLPVGRIAFPHLRNGTPHIIASTAADPAMFGELALGSQPSWSPDGSRIAFVRHTPQGQLPKILTMAADGSGQVEVGEGFHPSWSPDGQQLVFSQGAAIAVMRADGTSPTILVRVSDPGIPEGSTELGHPVWSPDGSTIAFESRAGADWTMVGSSEIHLLRMGDGALRPLTSDPWSKSGPTWSPDRHRGAELGIALQLLIEHLARERMDHEQSRTCMGTMIPCTTPNQVSLGRSDLVIRSQGAHRTGLRWAGTGV